MAEWWPAPEGVRVDANGGWNVGEFRIVHLPSLRFLKSRLVFEDEGAFLVEGERRLAVEVEGPAFEVTELRLDAATGEARVVLDDGSEEVLGPDSLATEGPSGRIECLVRRGRARAVFSRAAHQALLAHVEETRGRFHLRVGRRRLPIRAGA
ncbi:MAG TPA: hypothetical protein VMT70_12925 [Vicinamibacteria bacterium]|nr:hypothetical protein [Vicinamibacteria bacterium]